MIPNGKIAVPAYEPDKANYNEFATSVALNALPVADGWGPMASFVAISDALAGECLGSRNALATDGNYHFFAATSTNIYKLNRTTDPWSWDEVSKSTGAYTVTSGERWSTLQFGNFVYFAAMGQPIQVYELGVSATFADLSNAPTCKYIAAFGDFIMAMHLDGYPNRVQWCGVNAPTVWTQGTRGSDIQDLDSGNGEIMGGIGDPRGGIVLQRNAMSYFQFAPQSGFTFQVATANPERGTSSPYSIAQYGPNKFAYLCQDGFFAGVNGTPIGAQRVDQTIIQDIAENYFIDVQAVVDPFRQIIWWRYYSGDSVYKLIGWNWQLDRWCHSDTQLQEASAITASTETWDGLDNSYATIDDVAVPFDSRLFSSGGPVFSAFDTDNKLTFATGGNQAATLETGRKMFRKGRRTFVNGAMLEADVSDFTLQVGIFDALSDDATWDTAVNPESSDNFCSVLAEGLAHKFRISTTLNAEWETISNIMVDHEDGGEI
jgi:hypothetical protein